MATNMILHLIRALEPNNLCWTVLMWARHQDSLEAAWENIEPPWLAWLLVRIGYPYAEVITEPIKGSGTSATDAYNAVAIFCRDTGIVDEVTVWLKDRFPFEEVKTKLLGAI